MKLTATQLISIGVLVILFTRLMKVEKQVSNLSSKYNRLSQEAYTDDSSAENFNPSQPVQDVGSPVGNPSAGANVIDNPYNPAHLFA